MRNWTDTLKARQAGETPGFGVPDDLETLTRRELDDLAETRGIDPAGLDTKGDVATAITGV